MINITCPQCNTDGKISLIESPYEGPYKCWKCRELFNIEVHNGEVRSMTVLSQEEFNRQQELTAFKNKFRKG